MLLRISGAPPLANTVFRLPNRVSLLWVVSLPVSSKPHAEALTNSDGLLPRWDCQLPPDSLSWMSSLRVAASGTRSRASARHIRAMPSALDRENSCIRASTPLALVRLARTWVTSLRASSLAAARSVSVIWARCSISVTASVSSRR